MPDPTLHGNGYTCPACKSRREADRKRTVFGSTDIPCSQCAGTGLIAKTVAQIVAEQAAWAREANRLPEPSRGGAEWTAWSNVHLNLLDPRGGYV